MHADWVKRGEPVGEALAKLTIRNGTNQTHVPGFRMQ
jgi:hypothetical protein